MGVRTMERRSETMAKNSREYMDSSVLVVGSLMKTKEEN